MFKICNKIILIPSKRNRCYRLRVPNSFLQSGHKIHVFDWKPQTASARCHVCGVFLYLSFQTIVLFIFVWKTNAEATSWCKNKCYSLLQSRLTSGNNGKKFNLKFEASGKYKNLDLKFSNNNYQTRSFSTVIFVNNILQRDRTFSKQVWADIELLARLCTH